MAVPTRWKREAFLNLFVSPFFMGLEAVLLSMMISVSPINSQLRRIKYRLIRELPDKKQEIIKAFKDPKVKHLVRNLNRTRKVRKKYRRYTLEDYVRKHPAFSHFNRGIEFLEEYEEVFMDVERKYKVSRYDIAAIIGIESLWGSKCGKYHVLPQAIIYYMSQTKRKKKEEWFNHIKAIFEFDIDYLSPSSFAAAVGLPQFLPSSLYLWVDINNNGKPDFFDPVESIYSVANYLVTHGYEYNRDKAFYCYNHSRAYVQAVKLLADILKGLQANLNPRTKSSV